MATFMGPEFNQSRTSPVDSVWNGKGVVFSKKRKKKKSLSASTRPESGGPGERGPGWGVGDGMPVGLVVGGG